MFDSVRTRLTIWYVGALALAIVAFSVAVHTLLSRSLRNQLDSNLQASLDLMVASLAREEAEGEPEIDAAISTVEDLNSPGQAVALFNADGQRLAEKPGPGDVRSPRPPSDLEPSERGTLYTIPGPPGSTQEGYRVAARRVRLASTGDSCVIVASESLEAVTGQLVLLRRVFYVSAPAVLVLAGLGGWFLARKSLAPVSAMSERARVISGENLEQRLPVANPRDELGRLASTFNEMLERLNASFAQQRQFVADASHELRTPVSVMRTATEVTLEKSHREESEYREALGLIGQQTLRLTRIVEDMFALARADAGRYPLRRSELYVNELLDETVRAASVLAARKGVSVVVGPRMEAPYCGDEELLRQMLLNLLDNAVKYTAAGGTVTLSLASSDSTYRITVADTGRGIPPEAQSHIFERFYRAEESRARVEGADGAGAGLGLSIALWIAQAHSGLIELSYSGPTGTAFIVSLPLPA